MGDVVDLSRTASVVVLLVWRLSSQMSKKKLSSKSILPLASVFSTWFV